MKIIATQSFICNFLLTITSLAIPFQKEKP